MALHGLNLRSPFRVLMLWRPVDKGIISNLIFQFLFVSNLSKFKMSIGKDNYPPSQDGIQEDLGPSVHIISTFARQLV